jgi:hypothetical protein
MPVQLPTSDSDETYDPTLADFQNRQVRKWPGPKANHLDTAIQIVQPA